MLGSGSGAWIFPFSLSGQFAALVALQVDGVLRNLSLATLPAAGDRAQELKDQLAHIVWAGEIEGWLNGPMKWHLVADPVNATEWEAILQSAIGESAQVVEPLAPAELAARTAKRAAGAGKSNLLPNEFSVRYHQQFVDRLWLRGLFYAGLAYAVCVAIYFCATAVLNYRTSGVESQAKALSNTYTNSLQLKAVYNVLKERQQLKYAALDCWQWVAEELPEGITLQRMSFSDGKQLSLSGTVPQDQVNTLFTFNELLKKKKVNGQFVFDQDKGDAVNPKFNGNMGTWSLSLFLLHSEAAPR